MKTKVVTKKIEKVVAKKVLGFRPMLLSRHPSHNVLRGKLPRNNFSSIVRFGSTTESTAKVQINSIEAIKNSSSKLRMKDCFTSGDVKTAEWIAGGRVSAVAVSDWAVDKFPIVGKQIFGSRGRGNTLIKSATELSAYLVGKNLNNYIFEKFYNYVREYRLHVTEDGCFYTCRKMLKSDTPTEAKWFRNDSNCVWVIEENEHFDKPVNWNAIEEECVKALKSCELDFGACDLRIQSAKDEKGRNRENPDFIVVEINSAPSFGELTQVKYAEMLPNLILKKSKN